MEAKMGRIGNLDFCSPGFAARTVLVCFTALLLGHGIADAGDDASPIVIRGSSTLQPLVEEWARIYGQTDRAPAFDIEASGSSEGLESLLAGEADVAMASRPMSAEERVSAEEKGLTIHEIIAARMGIAVIVNHGNPISAVSVVDLADVFSGTVTSWQSVGGPDEPIEIVRKLSGWSPDFFKRRIMGDKEFAADSVIVDSKEEVVNEVADRPWSIGVTGMPEAIPALDRVNLLRLTSGDSDQDSTYALSRPLFLYSLEISQELQSFLDYVTSPKAQEMIVDTGFYPAKQADAMSTEE
jgi:phosphate transport system substrate-binding protein